MADRIIVIESDDWGAIRSPHPEHAAQYKSFFPGFEKNPYLKVDTLADSFDLEALVSVLGNFRDGHGKNPVVTFNTVVANPNFEQIQDSNYQSYHFELFTDTLKKYYPNQQVFNLWKQGIDSGFFYPQFHGREHVNVPVWLSLLQEGNEDILQAFRCGTWSTPRGQYPPGNVKLQAALDFSGSQPLQDQQEFVKQGLDLFEQIFGFRSATWIPNNFIASSELFALAKDCGVKGLQGMVYHVEPKGMSKNMKHTYTRRKFGLDKNGLVQLVRNCSFEPAQSGLGLGEVNRCLSQIKTAFFWKKPAVITSHRLNFIGAIHEQNRTKNLELLHGLLKEILSRWPDVRFMNSAELTQVYLDRE